MKIQTQHTSLRKVLIVALIAAISMGFIAIGIILSLGLVNKETTSSNNRVNLDPPTSNQLNDGRRVKEESLNEKVNSQDSTRNTVVTLTSQGVSENDYLLRLLIDRLGSSGTCSLRLESVSGDILPDITVGTQSLPGGSTCLGFNIPLSDLDSSTTWKAEINYADGEYTGSTSTDINL